MSRTRAIFAAVIVVVLFSAGCATTSRQLPVAVGGERPKPPAPKASPVPLALAAACGTAAGLFTHIPLAGFGAALLCYGVGHVVDGIVTAIQDARGTTTCYRQTRSINGQLVIDSTDCASIVTSSGFNGGPPTQAPANPLVQYEPKEVTIQVYPPGTVMAPGMVPPSTPLPPPDSAPELPPRTSE